ncbi:adenylyltransferase/cytidyltransferase family protein [Sulfitobacter sp. MF3-043]|uniref:adenylyltransferase/cytidyltransferase family protein n=1 Tax=Sulfitobacter sediminivivens TaxID=3252902 RepID=UPI0036DF2EE0
MTQIEGRHRVILTYGRFDQFGQNHIRLLRSLAALGDELIVGCASDDFAHLQGYPCLQSLETRRAILRKCRFVSRVITEESFEQKHTDVINYNVSVLAISAAWAGQCDHLRDIAQVLYLPDHEKVNAVSGTRYSALA